MIISSPFNDARRFGSGDLLTRLLARLLAQIAIARFPAAAVSVIADLRDLVYCTRVSRDIVVVRRDNDLV
jgi:hypothetical protein